MDSIKDIAISVSNFVLNKNDQLAANRIAICKPCYNFTKFGTCSYCHCGMALRVRNESLHCPINKW